MDTNLAESVGFLYDAKDHTFFCKLLSLFFAFSPNSVNRADARVIAAFSSRCVIS